MNESAARERVDGAARQHFRAVVAYDGTSYHGFQVQAQAATIQGELERVLAGVTGTQVRVIPAGRTDAGVHARGQVIAFRATWRHPWPSLQRALNALLPWDIVVRELAPAEPDFHPRFSARSREYHYHILNQPWRSPLAIRYAYHVSTPLDVAAMAAASKALPGVHDFAAFGQAPQGDNTVRQVHKAVWRSQGTELVFEIEANAFLRRMVRSLVGTLLLVGQGRLDVAVFGEILQSGERGRAGPPAPPQGLCLMQVNY
jgi:tRNA pseudouridine38-40 synthase